MSYNRCTEVSKVERLCNVWRRIVENDGLALTKGRRAVLVALFENLGQDAGGQCLLRQRHIQITVDVLGVVDIFTAAVELLGDGRGDLHGRAAQRLAQTEARKREVTHAHVGRIFQPTGNISGAHVNVGRDCLDALQNFLCDCRFDFQHFIFSFTDGK